MQGQTALDFAGLKHLFVHAYPQRLYQHDCSSSAIGKRTLYSIKHMQQIGFEAWLLLFIAVDVTVIHYISTGIPTNKFDKYSYFPLLALHTHGPLPSRPYFLHIFLRRKLEAQMGIGDVRLIPLVPISYCIELWYTLYRSFQFWAVWVLLRHVHKSYFTSTPACIFGGNRSERETEEDIWDDRLRSATFLSWHPCYAIG